MWLDIKSTFVWGSCEIIHPSTQIFWVWLDFRVATCFYMKQPKHPHFWLGCLTFGEGLFEIFHHHLSCFKCGLLIEYFEFILLISHMEGVTNYEWMIENELKRICNLHKVVRKSSQEIFSTELWWQRVDMFACEGVVALKLIFSMNVYNSILTYLNHVNCESKWLGKMDFNIYIYNEQRAWLNKDWRNQLECVCLHLTLM